MKNDRKKLINIHLNAIQALIEEGFISSSDKKEWSEIKRTIINLKKKIKDSSLKIMLKNIQNG